MQDIRVRPELVIRSRILALYDVIDELTRAFLVDNQQAVSEILRKGIVQRQYIHKVHIRLMDAQGRQMAEIVTEIDWERHRMRVREGKNEFYIDPSQCVHVQISGVFGLIGEHIERLKTDFGVVRSEVWYACIPEIGRNPIALSAAHSYLGVESRPIPPWSQDDDVKGTVFIRYVSQLLDELAISIRHPRRL